MQSVFSVEGQTSIVTWSRLQPPWHLRLGERECRVEHHRPGFILLDDGRCLRYAASSHPLQQELRLSLGGQTLTVQRLRQVRADGDRGSVDGQVKSPMNGVVVKVLAEAGQQVEAGQVVLVLEAMKMENEVLAPASGPLLRLQVQQGQVVASQQLLFEVQIQKAEG